MAGRAGGRPAIGALRLAGAACALSLSLAAMGCGGDESSDDEPAPAPATAAAEARPSADPSDEARTDRPEDEPAPRRGGRRSESPDGGSRKPDRTRGERSQPGRSDRSERRRRRRGGRRVTPRVDRSRFIAAGDAACADYREREARARGENDGQKSSQLRYLDTTAALIRELLDRLRAAPTPEADRMPMAGYIAAIEEVEQHVRRFRDALDREDRQSGEYARRVADTSAEARRLARGIGFRVCGAE